MAQSTYSTKLTSQQLAAVEILLKQQGFEMVEGKTEYEQWRAVANGVAAVMYTSGKLVVQGKETESIVRMVEGAANIATSDSGNSIGEVGLTTSRSPELINYIPHIGVDEAGKGDFFGSMIAASAFVSEENVEWLRSIGVGDSKKIRDDKILTIFEQLSEKVPFEIDVISPSEYNKQHLQTKNVAVMLARAHSRVIEKLLHRLDADGIECNLVVVDQFSQNKSRLLRELGPRTKEAEFQQFHKGESDIAVATASIVARAGFLYHWDKMEKEWEMSFPKGANNVIATGKVFVGKYGVDSLGKIAKTSFKTSLAVLAN